MKKLSPSKILLSFFGVGFFPYAPGTVGTLAALPFAYIIGHFKIPSLFFAPLLTVFTIIICYVTHLFQQKESLHDPGWIVIDEVLGLLFSIVIFPLATGWWIFGHFVLFRFFDIFKPWPVSYFDKMKHGAGVILDDIAAGILSGACLHLFYFIFKNYA